uniref:Uncharacterized protein n=1 Tax=Oryza punctata TaxID=4537 RepID=A0A0E0M8M1_ORYPU
MDLSFFHAQSKSPACVMIGLSAHCVKHCKNFQGKQIVQQMRQSMVSSRKKSDVLTGFLLLVFNGPVPFPVWDSGHLLQCKRRLEDLTVRIGVINESLY